MTAPVSCLCPPATVAHCKGQTFALMPITGHQHIPFIFQPGLPPYLLGETHCTVKKALPLYNAEATGWMQPGFGGIRLSLTG